MGHIEKILYRIKGFTNAILRYPLTALFLLGIAVLNGYNINEQVNKNQKLIFTLLVGAFLGIVVQVLYERYFANSMNVRLLLIGAAVILSAGYFIIIRQVPTIGLELTLRTVVSLFAIAIAFVWIPSIKNAITFNETFMITFKAFFITIFFAGVLFLGVNIIIGATNELLFEINYKANIHAANIIFVIFAPMYFLSLIPVYPIRNINTITKLENESEQELSKEELLVNRLSECPKFLEILFSYIIIPLVSVFTIILVLYIIINIGEGFWSNNLLEPMIVAYSITVIIVYILVSRLTNKFAGFYRRIFPKVLVPLVIIQTISSILRIDNMGLTHGRYYVILYGIFAAIAGVLFCLLPVKKNGIIAMLLIGFSLVSIIPPVDAFTISRVNQLNMLEDTLEENDMLVDGKVVINSSIAKNEKDKIIRLMNYMQQMGYIGTIDWLPEDFEFYEDFVKVFGFEPYEYYYEGEEQQFVYLNLPEINSIDISGFDYFIQTNFYINNSESSEVTTTFIKDGREYSVVKDLNKDTCYIRIQAGDGEELINIDTMDIFNRYINYNNTKGLMTLEEATFLMENELVAVKIIARNISIENMAKDPYYSADLILLIKVK